MYTAIHRHLKGAALLVGVSFLLVGCQPAPQEASTVVETTSVEVQTTDIAYAVDGGIEIERVDEGRIAYIEQKEGAVIELTWNEDGTRLGWITRIGVTGAKDTYFTINWANASDLVVETAYLSRIEPYSITFAPIGGYIGFIEGESLYSVQIENGEVYKVYEQLDRDQYAWSPEFAAVVVRGVNGTEYIEVEEGRPVSSVQVFDAPLDGLAFIDANTVLGVEQEQETARLHSIDLRTSTSEQIHEWEYEYDFLNESENESEQDEAEEAEVTTEDDGAESSEEDANETQGSADEVVVPAVEEEPEITDEMRMHRFRTSIGPTGDYVIQEYQLVGEDSAVYLYSVKKNRSPLLTDASVIGWSSKQSIIVESPADDAIRRVTVDTKQSIDLYESVGTYTVLAELNE